jgi:hypothetical protein
MGILKHRAGRLSVKHLCLGATVLLLVAGASSGIESCNGGDESTIRDLIEAEAHGGADIKTIEVHGDRADATTFLEGHEFEVELVKEGGKWTVDNCVDERTQEFPSQECPLNYLDISP